MEIAGDLPNYYAVLGISSSSTTAEIKKAYHKIARSHHPDRNPDGDVEFLKKATIAYEFLKHTNNRKSYDTQLGREKAFSAWDNATRRRPGAETEKSPHKSPTREPFAESSGNYHNQRSPAGSASMAAASAAFSTYGTEYSPHPGEGRTYTRRPRESKFSKRETPQKDRKNASAQRESPTSKYSSDTSKYSSDSSKFVEVKSNESDGENATARESSSAKSSTPANAKRTSQDPTESPSKRRRVFDMNELRNVSPFTQTYGTSFHFQTLNGAVPRPSSIPRKRNRPRSSGTDTVDPPVEHTQHEKLQGEFLRDLSREFTTSSTPHFNRLLDLHNERTHLNGSDARAFWDNLTNTKHTLEELLAGTYKALQLIQDNTE